MPRRSLDPPAFHPTCQIYRLALPDAEADVLTQHFSRMISSRRVRLARPPRFRPPRAMTTPKMAAMTPNSLGNAFGFSPALLGHSPAAASQFLLAKHGRSPLPGSGGPIPNYNSPSMLSALGIGSTVPPGVAALPPDESKRRELSEVLRLLASRPGRISAEAVERLAKGMGYGKFSICRG